MPDVIITLKTICCYCHDWDRSAPENQDASHGICDACYVRWTAALDAREAARAQAAAR